MNTDFNNSYYLINNESNFIFRGFQSLGEVATIFLLSTIGSVAAIVVTVASAILRGANLFIPGNLGKTYQEKISAPFQKLSLSVIVLTAQSWARMVSSFLGGKKVKEVDQRIFEWFSSQKQGLTPKDSGSEVVIDIPQKSSSKEPDLPVYPFWPSKKAVGAAAAGVIFLSLARFGFFQTAKTLLMGSTLVGGGISVYQGVQDAQKGDKRSAIMKFAGATALFTSALCIYVYFPMGLPQVEESTSNSSSDTNSFPPLLNSQKEKHIVFGTTYLNGNNPIRDDVSHLSVENHKEYADKWGLEHQAVTESLLKGECERPQPMISERVFRPNKEECVPYWNKIKMLKNWLEEPRQFPQKEEWRIYLDDDMPITNMNIDPSEAIDRLREGRDTSVIITTDIQPWDHGNPSTSVNTGVILVRRDNDALELINRIWEKRNTIFDLNDPECPTYGLCKPQRVFHEQQAFSDVLHEIQEGKLPHLKGVVSVVTQRDLNSSTRSGIALNTMYREGCFLKEGHRWRIDYSEDDSKHPEGIWQSGDWMGQVSGVPIWGRYCSHLYEKRPLRKELLQGLLKKVVG